MQQFIEVIHPNEKEVVVEGCSWNASPVTKMGSKKYRSAYSSGPSKTSKTAITASVINAFIHALGSIGWTLGITM